MKKKIFSLITAIALMLVTLTSCSVSWVSDDDKETETYYKAVPAPLVEDFKISDDLFNFEVALDYIIYDLPCKVSEFIENGWTLTYYGKPVNLSAKLPYGKEMFMTLVKGKVEINADVMNTSAEELICTECMVYQLSGFATSLHDVDFILSGNLVVDSKLTREDIIAIHSEFKEDEYGYLVYNEPVLESSVSDGVKVYQGGYGFYLDRGTFNYICIRATMAVKERYTE